MKNLNRTLIASVTAAAATCAVQPADAIGFGRVSPVAVLGQTLDVTVPVRVDAGERFDADCVHADVYYGENRILPTDIHTVVLAGASAADWRIRITTTAPITEPVVEIGVTAGCDRRFTRRFTAFADPPALRLAGAAPAGTAATAGASTSTPVATTQALPPGTASGGTELSAAADGSLRATPPRGASAGAGTRHARAVPKGPTKAAAVAAAAAQRDARAADVVATPAPAADAKGHGKAAAQATAGAEHPHLVLDAGYARLKLDMEDPVVPATTVAASGAGAAIGLSDLDTDADMRRMQALEQNLAALRKESQAARDRSTALQARLAQAESRTDWLPWLLAALGVSLLAIGGLGWRLRQQVRPRADHSWLGDGASISPPSAAEAALASVRVAAPAAVRPAPVDAGPSIAGELVADADEPANAPPELSPMPEDMTATRPLSRAALAAALGQGGDAAGPPRELSVEELLDLEQQADFFIALGQEDAAVDLLMSHLRSAGGQSPLPYTKLLEIYRRQGDRAAYERTRARFNRRFNAYAPDWDVGPGAGRTLEDYPDTIAQVQGAWPHPIDAMAILESLLFKRDDSSELFDLPAYRDVLVLYSLARDLWQQSPEATGALVDVLLPLDDADSAPTNLGDLPELSAGPGFVAAPNPQAAAAAASSASLDLPDIDLGLVPSKPAEHEPPAFELTGFDLLDEHADGVQATLDAGRLAGARATHGFDASNDESADESGGATRGPSKQR